MNALDPSRMTAAERLAEIGRILAIGYLRARNRARHARRGVIEPIGEVSLDFSGDQSGHGGTKTRRRESP
jgi:hypothetical protein